MARHVPRVYCPDLSAEVIQVPEFQVAHLVSVLRMTTGSRFFAFNKHDGEWICEVESIRKSTVLARKIELAREFQDSCFSALAVCIIKQDNMKLIIEKGTELGVTDFYLLRSEYTNAKCNVEKLKLIAISAIEQSERLDVPTIHEETRLDEFISNLPSQFDWYAAIERLADEPVTGTLTNPGFIIGPEGGFSDSEKTLIKQYAKPIRLSKNILRSETAAIVCAAMANR